MSKKDKLSTESYKGVRDFYPEDQAFLNYSFETYRAVAAAFGYVEYHASILEPAELYRGHGAENEEIVSEQTYTFLDRGGREVTLRPEMTPTVARMVAARRRELGFPLRLFSIPNVFRYERPQRGRLREHWQLNIDVFGTHSLAADAEVIAVAATLMRAFGAADIDFVIRVGSRAYLDSLAQDLELLEEEKKKLFKLLDHRAKMTTEEFEGVLEDLGVPLARLSADNPPEDVVATLALLADMGVENVLFDPSIVRGFNYYNGIVFEVFDNHPDNNRALFGGGRYDNLLELFDDEVVPGVGFGMGDVTMRDFLAVRGLLPPYTPTTKVYIAVTTQAEVVEALRLAQEMRSQGVNVGVDFGDKKLADQIKTATKHKIPWLLVVGASELQTGTFAVRNLESGEEEKVSREQLGEFFLNV